MALISLRIPDDVAARFSALALTEGGKSALLRRLIGEALEARPQTSGSLPIGKPQKITLRLRDSEMRQLVELAHRRDMSRTGWIVALVRARLGAPIQFSPGEREALRALMRELNRIGANINQIARAANGSALHGAAVDADLSDIREAKSVVEKTLAELRRVFDENAAYWEGR